MPTLRGTFGVGPVYSSPPSPFLIRFPVADTRPLQGIVAEFSLPKIRYLPSTSRSPHYWVCAILTAPSSLPTPHTNSSPRTPSSNAQRPAHLCNVPAQSSAPSTLSLNSPPAHQ